MYEDASYSSPMAASTISSGGAGRLSEIRRSSLTSCRVSLRTRQRTLWETWIGPRALADRQERRSTSCRSARRKTAALRGEARLRALSAGSHQAVVGLSRPRLAATAASCRG